MERGAPKDRQEERSHSVGEDLRKPGVGMGCGEEWIFWMLCLHHVPCSGIIWFSSVLATGGAQAGPFLPIPVRGLALELEFPGARGTLDKISGLDRF